jgi:hypothetical protein
MGALRYRALRVSLGDERRAAKLLGCSPSTIHSREGGYSRITEAAAARLLEAVYELAEAEDQRRAYHRARILEARADRRGMTPAELRAAFAALGWRTRKEQARRLLGDEGDAAQVSRWATGGVLVPDWVARNLRYELGLGPGDPWPTAARRHPVVLPPG